jgi:hypothetical protein
MIEVSSCVICDSPIRQLKRALVAPFMATRIWNRAPFCVDLVKCDSCGFIFYNPRLDDADLRRLYTGYRSTEYLKMRHDSEPWYTAKFNADLASKSHYETRRTKLAPILREHLRQRKISRVLDYGGDRGDLVVGLLDGAETYVFDISGIAPAPGVISTSDPASCRADLIINSNVLEHVGFPRELVKQVLEAAPVGGLVFLEVPCEIPVGFSRIARRLAQIAVMVAAHPGLARHIARPATFYMMHEHVNYYTEHCLTVLMEKCGGSVVASGTYPLSARAGRGDVGWCLGRKA